MILIICLGVFHNNNCSIIILWFALSNAPLKSTVIKAFLTYDFAKPHSFISLRAVIVLFPDTKPCWCFDILFLIASIKCSFITVSIAFASQANWSKCFRIWIAAFPGFRDTNNVSCFHSFWKDFVNQAFVYSIGWNYFKWYFIYDITC